MDDKAQEIGKHSAYLLMKVLLSPMPRATLATMIIEDKMDKEKQKRKEEYHKTHKPRNRGSRGYK